MLMIGRKDLQQFRIGAHTKTDLKVHLVWTTKYRRKVLAGNVAIRAREILRQVALEEKWTIISGKVSGDYNFLYLIHLINQLVKLFNI